jgi:hypothetical protein
MADTRHADKVLARHDTSGVIDEYLQNGMLGRPQWAGGLWWSASHGWRSLWADATRSMVGTPKDRRREVFRLDSACMTFL